MLVIVPPAKEVPPPAVPNSNTVGADVDPNGDDKMANWEAPLL